MFKLDISEVVQVLIESASGKAQFDKYIESLAKLPATEVLLACLRALSLEPKAHLVRLHLAKLFLQLDCASFAIDQLAILQKYSDSASLRDLSDKLNLICANQNLQQEATVLASLDFDIELLDNDKD